MAQNFFRRLTKKFFIISNLVLSALFLLGCYAWLFNPASWWFFGLLTLGSFYLLLLLLIFLFFWLFVKPVWSLITLLTLLLAWQPLQQLLPFRFTGAFEKNKMTASQLRVMSWNVEHFDILEHKTHPENKEKMLDLVTEYHPDIACFQEMVGSEKPAAINYVPGMVGRMDFTDFHYSYNSKVDFDGDHHFGIIIFSRYPMINKQTLSFYPNDYNSIFQYADIVAGADTIRVFNIHLQSLKFSASNLQYIDKPTVGEEGDMQKSKSVLSKLKKGFLKRQVQADRIKAEIEKSPYPVIVCGDFNDVPNSYAYHRIGEGLDNAFAKKGMGLGRTFSNISPTLRIDNIFTSPRLAVRQYTRVNRRLSDHFPVLADLEMEKK